MTIQTDLWHQNMNNTHIQTHKHTCTKTVFWETEERTSKTSFITVDSDVAPCVRYCNWDRKSISTVCVCITDGHCLSVESLVCLVTPRTQQLFSSFCRGNMAWMHWAAPAALWDAVICAHKMRGDKLTREITLNRMWVEVHKMVWEKVCHLKRRGVVAFVYSNVER